MEGTAGSRQPECTVQHYHLSLVFVALPLGLVELHRVGKGALVAVEIERGLCKNPNPVGSSRLWPLDSRMHMSKGYHVYDCLSSLRPSGSNTFLSDRMLQACSSAAPERPWLAKEETYFYGCA